MDAIARFRSHENGDDMSTAALSIRIRGVVQGVGFRPFVYRLAHEHGIAGWVLNGEEGVSIHAEGEETTLWKFVEELRVQAPPAALGRRGRSAFC